MTFNEFYVKFPRRIKRRDAEKAWNQAMKRGVDPDAIMFVLDLRIKQDWRGRKREFLPYPASFLRGEDFDLEFESQEDDKEAMSLFTQLETETNLRDRAELIHRSLSREQELWRRNAADHRHTEQCGWGERCVYRKEPRVPAIDELVAHLKGNR